MMMAGGFDGLLISFTYKAGDDFISHAARGMGI